MDDAEEELKKKLAQLERSVFDPSLNGRGEEIWARMLAIREHSKRLQTELERAGSGAAVQTEDELDENTMKIARKVCYPCPLFLHNLAHHVNADIG
jgi:nuclear pore complex protein Nup54